MQRSRTNSAMRWTSLLFALLAAPGCATSGEPDLYANAQTAGGKADDADDADESAGDASSGTSGSAEDTGDSWSDDSGSSGEVEPTNEIDAYIIGLGTIELPAAEVEEGVASAPEEQGDYQCTSTNMLETKQFDKIVAFANNSGTLYPGAIIGGETLSDGTLTPKVFDRAPLTFSASLEGVLAGDVSATLDKPSLSAFREAMSEILDAEVVGNTPANIAYDMTEVHSSEQLSLALGLDVSWMTGNVAASMEFNQQERNSRYLVNFTQAYYTVDVDPPARPSDDLDPSVSLDDVQGTLRDEPPAYVSSVTYGRIVYFAVTSNFSS